MSAAGYAPATGEPIDLTADLRTLGINTNATISLFADASATDATLTERHRQGNVIKVSTAPFGGFAAIIS